MIQIPVVGEYDCQTKEGILKRRGAVSLDGFLSVCIKSSDFPLLKKVASIWPSSATYEIVDGSYPNNRYGSLWYGKIDLGDDVSLGISEFIDMVKVQFDCKDKDPKQYSADEILEYLKTLIGTDLDVYKLMVKIGRL